mmetsp:Transcript_3595/g.22559  ORF Transcript_3595/g.22559 Transcript_3595/m.22559 type:complete len:413 (-) Transcript_3595:200-1438(-)
MERERGACDACDARRWRQATCEAWEEDAGPRQPDGRRRRSDQGGGVERGQGPPLRRLPAGAFQRRRQDVRGRSARLRRRPVATPQDQRPRDEVRVGAGSLRRKLGRGNRRPEEETRALPRARAAASLHGARGAFRRSHVRPGSRRCVRRAHGGPTERGAMDRVEERSHPVQDGTRRPARAWKRLLLHVSHACVAPGRSERIRAQGSVRWFSQLRPLPRVRRPDVAAQRLRARERLERLGVGLLHPQGGVRSHLRHLPRAWQLAYGRRAVLVRRFGPRRAWSEQLLASRSQPAVLVRGHHPTCVRARPPRIRRCAGGFLDAPGTREEALVRGVPLRHVVGHAVPRRLSHGVRGHAWTRRLARLERPSEGSGARPTRLVASPWTLASAAGERTRLALGIVDPCGAAPSRAHRLS